MDDNQKDYCFKKIAGLKYGENPHQKADLYDCDKRLDYEILSGELSYNNVLDLTEAIEIGAEFFDVASCTFVKHTNPIAVALAKDVEGAFDKALDSDPVNIFGGVGAFTRVIELPLAKKLNAISLDAVISIGYSEEALSELKKNKNLKIIKLNTPFKQILDFQDEEIKLTPFGALIQEKNKSCLNVDTFKVITKKKPEQEQLEDMIFAFKVVKHVKSSGVVVAKNLRTIGICAGQSDSVLALEFALNRVCDSPKDSVIASDNVLTSVNNIHIAAQNRVSAIIQPAGSIKDKDIIQSADKLEISMVSTGIRHLKH